MQTKIRIPDNLGHSYQIYPPSGGHKGFRIIKKYRETGKMESVKSDEILKINEQFMSKALNEIDARLKLEAVRTKLYERDGGKKITSVVNSDNKKLLKRYWEAEYVPRLKTIADPDTALYELQRAVDAVGILSLKTASQKELQSFLDKTLSGNKHRRAISKLNTLLKFAGRDFRLNASDRVRTTVKYLTLDEFNKLLTFIDDPKIRLLHQVCFCTGVRVGEAFALEAKELKPLDNVIGVMHQIDKAGTKREARNKRERTAMIIAGGTEALNEWFKLRSKVPTELRTSISRYTKKAARQAFPGQLSKHISFDDLRHSYAIHLLSKAVPLQLVAHCLGISPIMAEEHYAALDMSQNVMSLISNRLKNL